jgi:hypothetical protein
MPKLLARFDSINKYIVTAIILAIPLYPKFPLFTIPGSYVSVRLEDFLVLASLVLFGIINFRYRKEFLKDKVFITIVFFLTVGLLSYISAILITSTVEWRLGLLHWARRVEYISMFFVGFYSLKSRSGDLSYYLKLFPIVILLVFIYGFGQRYLTWPIIITQNEEYAKGVALRYVEGSHINSTFAGHYDLATYLVLFLPLILALIVYLKKKSIFLILSYFAGLWLLVNTASRISFVSFFLSATLALIMIKRLKKGIFYLLIGLLFIGFSSNLIVRYKRVFQIINSGIKKYAVQEISIVHAEEPLIVKRENETPTPTPIPVFEDRSTSIRLNVEWPRAIRAFSKNPLLGTGYSSITLATDNDYLRMLGETGISGLSSFFLIFANLGLVIIIFITRERSKDTLERVFVTSFLCGFLGVLINAVFIDVFEASKLAIIFWLLSGMLYSVSANKTN